MNLDFYLNNTSRFNARCSAIIFNKDKTKVLIFKINDGRDYYLLPGGRIEFNETSINAIKREIKEETGFDLDFNLINIQENFVEKSDVQIMQYDFCFSSIYYGKTIDKFQCLDNGGQTFYWIDIEKVDNYLILPKISVELIKRQDNKILHSVERKI